MKEIKNLLKSLLKSSKKEPVKTEVMTETMKRTKRYQWIKGDKLGNVVEVAEDQKDKKWLYFSDGSRINPTLIGEFLMEINDDSQVLQVQVPTDQPAKIEEPAKTESRVKTQAPQKSVMGQMIEKMSKKNVVQIPINLNINIPTSAIYAMLAEGMEEEDLNEEIMQVALSQLEIDKLQYYIKENLSNFLNTYYGK